jgi:phytoene synthase
VQLPARAVPALIEAKPTRSDDVALRTYEELLALLRPVGQPVGELVLHVFGAATPDRISLSDSVCSGLQLVEHWQDVREDFARGRVYLPTEDLERFGVARTSSAGATPTPQFRRLLAFEVDRARRLLDDGAPLIRRLHGRARLAVAGYVAGGRAALDAVAAADFDVLGAHAAQAARNGCAGRSEAYGLESDGRSRIRRVPTDRAGVRVDLLRRDANCCPRTGETRSSPSTRSRGASTTSADGGLSPTESSPSSRGFAAALPDLREPGSGDPVLAAVADAASRYPIRSTHTTDLVDGAEMDARGHVYVTFADTELYSRRVAGSIGRLALGVFETSDLRAPRRSPTTSASRSSSRTSSATSARTSRSAASTCPRGSRPLRLQRRRRRLDGPVELLVRSRRSARSAGSSAA